MSTTVYRQARVFPPDESSYVCALERRGGRSFGNPVLDIAGRGLSVMADLESARTHALRNKRLGNVLVRYHIPDGVPFSLAHLVGDEAHLTFTMDPLTDLAEYLDKAWCEILEF